ncbi:unnamed protein product [Schistocephalus solidus]|uniref:Uncharacterized protein n=1 Tax=Schistocephalus solidus TaxID=70667 RepID=A0A183SI35_SCHSO|nr:unnamed protein product [Schistocephalus solidus]
MWLARSEPPLGVPPHLAWERTQVAGAAGAAPGRTTTPGSDPTERTQVAGAAGSPKSKPPLGVPQVDAGGWRGCVL